MLPLQLCAASASAETRQFANVVYELPKGWEPNGKADGRLGLRYDGDYDRCNDCRIWIGVEGAGSGVARRDSRATQEHEGRW